MIKLPATFPVTAHTDFVGPGSTFVIIKGERCDGAQFIPMALQKGATKLVVGEKVKVPANVPVPIVRVANPRKALAQLSAQALGHPANKLKIIGITGTKGKTTTAFLLEHLLRATGHKTALLSTVHNKINDQIFSTKLTTQQPDYLHVFFDACVQAGVEYVVMEVAAQALTLHRVDGINFAGIIFTNFAQEHAEFYDTLDDYFKAKCQIFDHVAPSAPVVINADDAWLQKLGRNGFSLSDVRELKSNLTGLRFVVDGVLVQCPTLFGEFNAYNVLSALTLAQKLGVPLRAAADALTSFGSIPGRLECHELLNGARCFVDYAHNPSSFEALLSTLRPLTNQLIVVFGAAGNRDTTKRPRMGDVATRYADVVVLTTDNPRFENPEAIMASVCAGVPADRQHKIVRELDREQAIKKAYALSQPGGIIAVLGKGPDAYQEVQGVKHFFSDVQVVQRLR